MQRALLIVATVFAAGCPSPSPHAPRAVDDRPLRIQIARAEAKRAAGVAELVELATHGEVHARELAVRGLGRIGTPEALHVLVAAVMDRDPAVAMAALRAIGVAGSLDDFDAATGEHFASVAMEIAIGDPRLHLAMIDVLGRVGGAATQVELVRRLYEDPETAAEAAIALGRHGRRKLALGAEARAALVVATRASDVGVRYAATYALSREHEPPADEAVTAALIARIADDDPETRATAIAGLARRKATGAASKQIVESLRDRDWRVAVEAVRALTGADSKSATLLEDLEEGLAARKEASRQVETKSPHGIGESLVSAEATDARAAEAHVVIEMLRALAGSSNTLAATATNGAPNLVQITPTFLRRGSLAVAWIFCHARAISDRVQNDVGLADAHKCVEQFLLPEHLALPIFADLVTADVGTLDQRRDVLRVLLEHDDARVRAAGLGALPAMWKSGGVDHAAALATMIAAIGSPDPIIAGSAVEAAPALYAAINDVQDATPAIATQLDAAIVARAAREQEPEAGAALYELIAKRTIASGADACRSGLTGHPVRARAAAACLKALGEAVPAPIIGAATPPPVDVADVIGKTIHWHVVTTQGEIVIELRPDIAPWNVATIVALTKRGFYNGLEFHRVVPNFVAQGGDPTMSGWGGPGFVTPAEPSTSADGQGFSIGGVGIADAGRDSGGSQWFVMHSRAPHLDGRYTWVGKVISGQKSADALLIGDKIVTATIEVR